MACHFISKMADQHAGVVVLSRPGEVSKDTPDTAITFCHDSELSLLSQPTPAQRPAQHMVDSDQASLDSSGGSERSDRGRLDTSVASSDVGVTDSETTCHAETPDKSSASRSSTSLSSEGSLTETEGSQSPSDPSILFPESQTPKKGQGKINGSVVTEGITTQSRGDTSKKRYGDTPHPNTCTINSFFHQVRHKPEGQDSEQRSLMPRPCSGTGAHAHPAPSIKPGTEAGTQDNTGTDPGKSVFRFDGTPKGYRTPSKGTADGAGTGTGTKAVSRTTTRKTGNKAKTCLSYSEVVQEKIAFPTVGNSALLSPRTPFSLRGKRKHTGLSPEQNRTPSKRAILEPSVHSPPPSSSTDQLQSSLEITCHYIASMHERELGTDSIQTKQKERQQRPHSSNSTSTFTQAKRTGNNGNNKRGPTSVPPKTPSVAESIYTFITINIVRDMLTPPRAMEVINSFTNYSHPDNIKNRWGPRKKLGPTFLVKKAVLDKAKAFIYHSRLSFDIKVDQSDFLPRSRNDQGKTTYTRCKPSDAPSTKATQFSNSSETFKANQTHKNRRSTGILENIPLSIDMETLKGQLSKATQHIKSVHRVLNRNKKPTKLVKVTFNCYPAPLTLKGETTYEVNPCKVPCLRCNSCQEPGHSTKDCRNNQIKCPLCSLEHLYKDCPFKGNKRAYKCANCELNHGAAFSNCTIF